MCVEERDGMTLGGGVWKRGGLGVWVGVVGSGSTHAQARG